MPNKCVDINWTCIHIKGLYFDVEMCGDYVRIVLIFCIITLLCLYLYVLCQLSVLLLDPLNLMESE